MRRCGMNGARYEIVSDGKMLVLRDVGPWSEHPTVTNDAEQVVEELAARVGGRRLLYYDSDGELTEIRHDGAKFIGFGFVSESESITIGKDG